MLTLEVDSVALTYFWDENRATGQASQGRKEGMCNELI
jgi:hypothetical protein